MISKAFLKSETEKIRKLLSKLMKTNLLPRDFYWRYDRGLENVDTQKEYTIKGDAAENLDTKKKELT